MATKKQVPEPEPERRRALVGWWMLAAAFAGLAIIATTLGMVVAGPLTVESQPGIVLPSVAPTEGPIPAPAISASPADIATSTTTELFDAPDVTVIPPPPPPVTKTPGSSGRYTTTSSGTVVDVCSLEAFSTRTVTSAPYSSAEQANFVLLNQARTDAGLSELSWSDNQANHARAWASFLAQNNCAIYHGDNWQNGENIYWRSGGSLADLASYAHSGFMGSAGHQANILRDWFASVGIGVAQSPSGAWYLVQNFGA